MPLPRPSTYPLFGGPEYPLLGATDPQSRLLGESWYEAHARFEHISVQALGFKLLSLKTRVYGFKGLQVGVQGQHLGFNGLLSFVGG